LTGDAVDNIPGVPGIGAKTASNLLTRFQSIDELFRRLAEVQSEVLRANLQASIDLVGRNQQLVRLHCQEPCEFSLEDLAVKPADTEALRGLFSKWGFRTLLRELGPARETAADLFGNEMGAR
jgi:DNA polymerase-1